jgi:hypothetical protein
MKLKGLKLPDFCIISNKCKNTDTVIMAYVNRPEVQKICMYSKPIMVVWLKYMA